MHLKTTLLDHLRPLIRGSWPSPCRHVYYALIYKTLLTWVKEKSEISPKFTEELLDEDGLILRLQMSVEISRLDDKVVVVPERCLCLCDYPAV